MRTRYFSMRMKRHAPLVPARLQWLDHAPEDPPWNKLDRGTISLIPVVDIAGEYVPPERLFERFGVVPTTNGYASLPDDLLLQIDDAIPPLPTHWKYLRPITETEYIRALREIREAEKQPTRHAPVLSPRKNVRPEHIDTPSFDREREIL